MELGTCSPGPGWNPSMTASTFIAQRAGSLNTSSNNLPSDCSQRCQMVNVFHQTAASLTAAKASVVVKITTVKVWAQECGPSFNNFLKNLFYSLIFFHNVLRFKDAFFIHVRPSRKLVLTGFFPTMSFSTFCTWETWSSLVLSSRLRMRS